MIGRWVIAVALIAALGGCSSARDDFDAMRGIWVCEARGEGQTGIDRHRLLRFDEQGFDRFVPADPQGQFFYLQVRSTWAGSEGDESLFEFRGVGTTHPRGQQLVRGMDSANARPSRRVHHVDQDRARISSSDSAIIEHCVRADAGGDAGVEQLSTAVAEASRRYDALQALRADPAMAACASVRPDGYCAGFKQQVCGDSHGQFQQAVIQQLMPVLQRNGCIDGGFHPPVELFDPTPTAGREVYDWMLGVLARADAPAPEAAPAAGPVSPREREKGIAAASSSASSTEGGDTFAMVLDALADGCGSPPLLRDLQNAYEPIIGEVGRGSGRIDGVLRRPEGGASLLPGLGPATLRVVQDEGYSELRVPVLDGRARGLPLASLAWFEGIDNGISVFVLEFAAPLPEVQARLAAEGVRLRPGDHASPVLEASPDGGQARLVCDHSM